MNSKRLEEETINYVNEDGYSPFLFYVKQYVKSVEKIKDKLKTL